MGNFEGVGEGIWTRGGGGVRTLTAVVGIQ